MQYPGLRHPAVLVNRRRVSRACSRASMGSPMRSLCGGVYPEVPEDRDIFPDKTGTLPHDGGTPYLVGCS
jgi:hypothetical protein